MRKDFLVFAAAALLLSGTAQAGTIVETAQQAGTFTKLLAAGKAAGVDKALGGKGPFTIFAPDDAAFAKVPQAKLDMLMKPANRNKLKTTLGAHLLTGRLTMQAIEAGLAQNDAVVATTINNMPLVFKKDGGQLTVNGAQVKRAMTVSNGLVYIIDAVLVPPMPLQPAY